MYPSELYMWLCVVQVGACTPVSCTCGYVLSRLGRVPQSVVEKWLAQCMQTHQVSVLLYLKGAAVAGSGCISVNEEAWGALVN